MSISTQEFNLLRQYIEESCGIIVGDAKSYLIESRLNQLVLLNGCTDFTSFYNKAKNDKTGAIKDKIIDAITTNETMWFRDERTWATLKNHVFPSFLDQLKTGKKQKLRIWSAACSTGQEPYSLVMLINSLKPSNVSMDQVEITATDISPNALYLAIAGRYNQIEMSRGMPESFKTKYFKNEKNVWSLTDEIKAPIKFKRFNLQDNFNILGKFDIIFCRNVAIYFSDEFKKDFFKRLSMALNPDGLLFLGASESLLGHSQHYDTVEKDNAIYYKPKNNCHETINR